MPARIFCKTGKLKGISAEIDREVVLGRSRGATVRLAADPVSGEHARIRYQADAGCYVLEDLGSTNGTELDGVRVRGPERLGHLHVITLADRYDFIFQDLERCARRHGAAAPAAALAAQPLADDTAIDEEPPPLPELIAAAEAAGAPAAAAPLKDETVIDDEPPPLPELIAAAQDSPVERTRIHEAVVQMPSSLVDKAEDVAAEAGDQESDDAPSADGTRIQQLPVQMPDFLARKAAKEAQRTVDLPEGSAPEEDAPEEDALEEDAASPAVSEDQLEQLLLTTDGSPPVFGLEVRISDENVERFRLQDGDNPVGRAEDAALRIVSPDVSRRHAVLTVDGGTVTVRDVGSSNHTFLAGKRIDEAVEVPLGVELRFGGVKARLIRREGD